MITPVVYVFLVHVIVCTTAEGRDAGNQTRTLLSSQNDTHRSMNVFASNKTNKECRVAVNETDLSSLQQLARSKIVHIVQIDLQFASNISNSIYKEWRWRLTNNVGKEILSVLAMKNAYRYVTWTLDAGRKTAKVRVIDHPPGCVTSEKEPGDFIAGAILKQLSFAYEKEICFDKVLNKSTLTTCCKISIGNDPFKCDVSLAGSGFVNVLESMLSVYTYFTPFCGFAIVVYFGVFLQLKNTNNTKGYYKLTESPMSVSSILCMLFWDGYGKFKSFVRRCLLIVLFFLLFLQAKSFDTVLVVLAFSLWAVFYPFSRLLELVKMCEVTFGGYFYSRQLLEIFSSLGYDINDVHLSCRVNVSGAISLITLPFNIKRWKISLVRFYHKFIEPDTLGSSLRDKALLFSKTGVFCFFYIVFVIILQVIFVLSLMMDCYYTLIKKLGARLYHASDQRRRQYVCVWAICIGENVCLSLTIVVVVQALTCIPFIIISLVSGLILNVVYFFPYVVSISVLTFYSWMFWSSVEQQYVVLMRLIFDNNIHDNNTTTIAATTIAATHDNNSSDTTHDNNSSDNNSHNDDNSHNGNEGRNRRTYTETEIVCVVSKDLYDNIRERLLPYHGNLFWFVINVLGISIFAYIILTLVRVLQATDVSSTVQLLTTFSVSAFPYIMNTVAGKKGEEQMDAWKEQLKHSVKPLLNTLTADKPDLRRTQLIIKHVIVHPDGEEPREEQHQSLV